MATLTAPTYTKSGNKATTAAKLESGIFGVMPMNHELIKYAYISYLANGRDNLAKTKTRGLVSGGGIKPWRQKGTGRARVGSSRSPIWRSGGIVFGPTGQENYSKRMTVASKRQALKQALSLAAQDGKIRVIEAFVNKDAKVSATAKLFKQIEAKGSILLVLDHKDAAIERATGNLPTVQAVQANYLNVYNVLNSDTLVISEPALQIIKDWLGGDK